MDFDNLPKSTQELIDSHVDNLEVTARISNCLSSDHAVKVWRNTMREIVWDMFVRDFPILAARVAKNFSDEAK